MALHIRDTIDTLLAPARKAIATVDAKSRFVMQPPVEYCTDALGLPSAVRIVKSGRGGHPGWSWVWSWGNQQQQLRRVRGGVWNSL
jgi:hypothetical protein